MGKRKRKEAKPWCFYCDHEFVNEKVLVDHQKARHFKCPHCGKKLPSSGGLQAHVLQVHKETIDKVPNAKEGRDSMEFGVYGMENIPDEFLDEDELEEKRKKTEANRPAVPIPPMLPGMVPGVPMVPTMVPAMPGMMPPYGAVMAGHPGFRGPMAPPMHPGMHMPPHMPRGPMPPHMMGAMPPHMHPPMPPHMMGGMPPHMGAPPPPHPPYPHGPPTPYGHPPASPYGPPAGLPAHAPPPGPIPPTSTSPSNQGPPSGAPAYPPTHAANATPPPAPNVLDGQHGGAPAVPQ
mmetsp:Transcript_62665/g.111721  ORF Transcript_62665/g.111721 Transcript_62665/m.111721 type:complete len:291 (-) Transcript_62665:452-1324(-)